MRQPPLDGPDGSMFLCEACGGIFEAGRSEEEAIAESTEVFGRPPEEDWAMVCDDCFKRIMDGMKLAQ